MLKQGYYEKLGKRFHYGIDKDDVEILSSRMHRHYPEKFVKKIADNFFHNLEEFDVNALRYLHEVRLLEALFQDYVSRKTNSWRAVPGKSSVCSIFVNPIFTSGRSFMFKTNNVVNQ